MIVEQRAACGAEIASFGHIALDIVDATLESCELAAKIRGNRTGQGNEFDCKSDSALGRRLRK